MESGVLVASVTALREVRHDHHEAPRAVAYVHTLIERHAAEAHTHTHTHTRDKTNDRCSDESPRPCLMMLWSRGDASSPPPPKQNPASDVRVLEGLVIPPSPSPFLPASSRPDVDALSPSNSTSTGGERGNLTPANLGGAFHQVCVRVCMYACLNVRRYVGTRLCDALLPSPP
jgi:hypothetical protein